MNAVTEAEAKEKWCPFSRVSWYSRSTLAEPAEYGYAGNRDANDGTVPGAQCIASACMAWRGVDVYDPRERHLYNTRTGNRVSGGLVEETEWRLDNPDEPPPEPRGYCGLAGRTTP